MEHNAHVTFLHAADLHIGAPFTGIRHTTPELAHSLVSAITRSFDRFVQTALDRHVDFVVLAGDTFDRARPSYADFQKFYNGMSKLDGAHIPVYVCNGNHDPWSTWNKEYGDLPKNVHIFSADGPEFFVYRRQLGEHSAPVATLGGRSFLNATFPHDVSIAQGITKIDARKKTGVITPFYIGVIHTGLDLDRTQAYVPRATLFASGMDYWALGHIHKRMVLTSVQTPGVHVVYSGCIQGRDVLETGPRGCELVTLEQGKDPKLSFIPLSSIVWEQSDVDVSECITLQQVSSEIRRNLQAIDAGPGEHKVIVRVILHGASPISALFTDENLNVIRHGLNEHHAIMFCDSIIDHTHGIRNDRQIEREGLFGSLVLQGAAWESEHPQQVTETLERDFSEKGEQLPPHFDKSLDDTQKEALELVFKTLGGEIK